jgi:hypothetical protein
MHEFYLMTDDLDAEMAALKRPAPHVKKSRSRPGDG